MGKPGQNSKVADKTAGEGFEKLGEEILSPLLYEGRGGGNPDSPKITGINPDPRSDEPLVPSDPMGFLPEGATKRGKRGGAY